MHVSYSWCYVILDACDIYVAPISNVPVPYYYMPDFRCICPFWQLISLQGLRKKCIWNKHVLLAQVILIH